MLIFAVLGWTCWSHRIKNPTKDGLEYKMLIFFVSEKIYRKPKKELFARELIQIILIDYKEFRCERSSSSLI